MFQEDYKTKKTTSIKETQTTTKIKKSQAIQPQ